MPRTRAGAAASHNSDVAEKSMESEEQVDLDGDNDPEETMEEEVEYEEVEEEEEEEDEEEKEAAKGDDAQKGSHGDYARKVDQAVENVRRKHAELLSLPPHGSEVYLGGIPHDASEEDLRGFCESIGEVREVRTMKAKDLNGGKPYAFVTFRTKELASRAIEELNNSEFKGKKGKVFCKSSKASVIHW